MLWCHQVSSGCSVGEFNCWHDFSHLWPLNAYFIRVSRYFTGVMMSELTSHRTVGKNGQTFLPPPPLNQILGSTSVADDKVRMYEEMMMNDDNVESSLLTSSLLKICSLYKFYVEFCCYKLHMSSWISRWTELCSSCIY